MTDFGAGTGTCWVNLIFFGAVRVWWVTFNISGEGAGVCAVFFFNDRIKFRSFTDKFQKLPVRFSQQHLHCGVSY